MGSVRGENRKEEEWDWRREGDREEGEKEGREEGQEAVAISSTVIVSQTVKPETSESQEQTSRASTQCC